VRVTVHSYRFAEEIIQHGRHHNAWDEIHTVLRDAPLFVYQGKSASNAALDVVQQVMNTYFDRRLAIDLGWEYHPLATSIAGSNLAADYRKTFGNLVIQAEFQFGNMGRWYSDVFKFQTAYSQKLINLGLSVVPMYSVARRIDSNVVNYERTLRELPSADLSITLPIILAGLDVDDTTRIVDLRQCQFANIREITGRGNADNRWRIVHGYLSGTPMNQIGPGSPTGPRLAEDTTATDADD